MSIDVIVVSTPTDRIPKEMKLYETAIFKYVGTNRPIYVPGEHFKVERKYNSCSLENPDCESCQ